MQKSFENINAKKQYVKSNQEKTFDSLCLVVNQNDS